jgi:hypothetical protein
MGTDVDWPCVTQCSSGRDSEIPAESRGKKRPRSIARHSQSGDESPHSIFARSDSPGLAGGSAEHGVGGGVVLELLALWIPLQLVSAKPQADVRQMANAD